MKNHFDQEAQNWDKNQINIKRTEAIAALLPQMVNIKPAMKALDFGAGTGLMSFALKDQFAEITLMDSSVEMINVVVSKIKKNETLHFKPVVFDLEKDNYDEDTFDIIFTQMALHHIENIEAILRKFSDLLNPGGILAIADLYKENGSFHNFDFKGHYGFDPVHLSRLLSAQGFTQVNFKNCFVIEKQSSDGVINKFPVFLMTGIK